MSSSQAKAKTKNQIKTQTPASERDAKREAARAPDAASSMFPRVNSAPSERFYFAALAILIVAIALRQWNLGAAPFHPDESIHAYFSQGFANYKYDPVYHGPLLYHLVTIAFALGQHDYTARLMPSLLGIGLVAMTLFPARKYLGNRAALASAGMLAISPSLVTYSRHLLHDALVLVLTLGAVLCFSSMLKNASNTDAGRNARVGLAACLTLFLATKANVFFIAVMLLAFYIAWRGAGRFTLPSEPARWVPILCFAVVTLAAIAFPRDSSQTEALKYAQHMTFQIVALGTCAWMWGWLWTRPIDQDERQLKRPTASSTKPSAPLADASSTKEFERETAPSNDIVTYALALAVALWLYVFLYGNGAQILNQWFTNRAFPSVTFSEGAESARGAIGKMLGYWGGQQAQPRLPGRHDYYIVLGLLYELPIFIAALGGVWHAAKNRNAWTDLLLWWAFTSWAVYAVANEKVPWLLVHILLPLALLGGVWLGQIKWKKPMLAGALALGALFLGRGAIAMVVERAGDNAEPLLYAQVPEAFRDATEAALLQTRGDKRAVWVASEASVNDRQWPTIWYLRPSNPLMDGSVYEIGSVPNLNARFAIDGGKNLGAFPPARWQVTTVSFHIWPRASWGAFRPDRFARWFATRDTLPQNERLKPQNEWDVSILSGAGEWSIDSAIVATPR